MSQADIDQLASWRTLGARNSQQVVDLAPKVLAAGGLGDAEWSVREQLAIAALDLGQISLANAQIRTLETRFPKSPRVDILLGLKLEALGEPLRAGAVYKQLLMKDETNVSARQRFIALAPNREETITRLLKYLDIFYADPQGWSLLAELYADAGAYAQSLTALGHLMVLQTWDSMAVVRAAETAYTIGDYQLALKYFLRAVEMETPPTGNPDGHRTRAWWGVQMSSRRLLESTAKRIDSAVPDRSTTSRAQLEKLNALATERILAIGGAGMQVRRAVLAG
ncbi:hypothetical protein CcaverHIS002_0205710 [Cutaneotrichosporon cavernicola]|uniref:ER membrane protein complex subunit 2 n=1 Tax=Cutaneotrichosporon cavernicola TaxID=279322 RepID=A0AA48IDS7_9TREE|nr:uncharacterized protein CcaverHIS019_0205680 [Cutaneotrichosporon cavernicola]BEI81411.1 hypothetical protein CcaverHIS002_0205710 [Cutaneotrichosporon cavernicola]BEI89206.1 hypothetical protein CcaverHIS019_0205680 [Cutaneotrichosporon cavernicola]BEI96982.1 hypothetical protein CcaverHIS631_0205710 [Cutaneotrichosporon cavernicola]